MRTTKGRLFKRHTERHGDVFWIDYTIHGERIRHKLEDEHGQPVTTARKAQKIADGILHPHRAKDEAQRAKMAANAYNSALDEARAADEASKPKTPIEDMWERNPWDTSRRGSYERRLADSTIRDNESQFHKFAMWADANSIRYAEDVRQVDGS